MTVVNNWNISPGIAGTVRAELARELPRIEKQTTASVQRALKEGRPIARNAGTRQ